MEEGWIKLHRKLINWKWYKKPHMVHLFIHLILKANHKDKYWEGIEIKRGQLVTGLNSLNEQTGISIQSLRSCLGRLKLTHELTIKPTNKYSLITIVNYEEYNIPEDKPTSGSTSKLTTNQHSTNIQLTTNKNEKNEKNEKKHFKDLDINSAFMEYISLRKRSKWPVSDLVINRLVRKLREYAPTKEKALEIIEKAITSKWKDFYPVEEKKDKVITSAHDIYPDVSNYEQEKRTK